MPCWQENAKLYRWETKHRNDHFSLSEESQKPEPRRALCQSESLRLDDSIFIGPRTLQMWTQQFDKHGTFTRLIVLKSSFAKITVKNCERPQITESVSHNLALPYGVIYTSLSGWYSLE